MQEQPIINWNKVKRVTVKIEMDTGDDIAVSQSDVDPRLLALVEKPSWWILSEALPNVDALMIALAKRQAMKAKKGLL